jgi:hypothetical protein
MAKFGQNELTQPGVNAPNQKFDKFVLKCILVTHEQTKTIGSNVSQQNNLCYPAI